MESLQRKYIARILLIMVFIFSGCAGTNKPTPRLEHLVASSPDVMTYRGKDYTAYQSGDVRVYFSPWQQLGFDGFEDQTREELLDYYQKSLNELGILFKTGLVTGEMFYDRYKGYRYLLEAKDESSNPKTTFEPNYEQDIVQFKGRAFKVLYYEKHTDPTAPYVVTFQIWAQLDKTDSEWGSFDHYTLMVTLPNIEAKEYTMRYQGGKLLELDYIKD